MADLQEDRWRRHAAWPMLALLAAAVALWLASTACAEGFPGPVWGEEVGLTGGLDLTVEDIAFDDGSGEGYVVAQGHSSATYGPYLKHFDGGRWSGWIQVPEYSQRRGPTEPDLAIDGRGDAHVVWINYSADEGYPSVHHRGYRNGRLGPETVLDNKPGNVSRGGPSIVASGDELHVVWWEEDLWHEGIYYRHFDGRDWKREVKLDSIVTHPSADPAITMWGDELLVTWREDLDGDWDVWGRLFDGRAWLNAEEVSVDEATEDQVHHHAVRSGDTIYLAWQSESAGIDRVHLRSRRGGEWGDVRLAGSPPHTGLQSTPWLQQASGNVLLAWSEGNEGNTDVLLQVHNGSGWEAEMEASGGAGIMTGPCVSAQGDGLVHMAWNWLDTGQPRIVYRNVSFDNEPPTAILEPPGRIWIDDGGLAINWSAEDDFALYDVDLVYRHSPDNVTWTSWRYDGSARGIFARTAQGTFRFLPEKGEGVYELAIIAEDVRFDVTWSALTRLVLDLTPPTGTVRVEGGAPYTSDARVRLDLTWSDVLTDAVSSWGHGGLYSIRLSNDGAFEGTPWSPASSPSQWTLRPGDGVKRVHLQVRDGAGLASEAAWDEIELDTTPPGGALVIDGDAEYTSDREVVLDVTAWDEGSGVAEVRFSNDGTWDEGGWRDADGEHTWLLGPGDGEARVRMQLRDRAGVVSEPVSDLIVLDTTPPTATMTVGDGSGVTGSRDVALHLELSDATSGVAGIRLGNDGDWGTQPWEAPASRVDWTLSPYSGDKSVFLQARDAAGLVSTTFRADVVLDLDTPHGSVSVLGNASRVSDPEVTLALRYSDPTSWVVDARYGSDGLMDTERWEPASDQRAWSLPVGEGTWRVYFQVRDAAGWESDVAWTEVVLDTTRPRVLATSLDGMTLEVGVDDAIVLELSEEMDRGSVQGAFDLRRGNRVVEGSFRWSPDGTSVVFTPSGPLDRGSRYVLGLGEGARDLAGNPLEPFELAFETEGKGLDEPTGWVGGWVVLLVVAVAFVAAGVVIARRRRWPRRPAGGAVS